LTTRTATLAVTWSSKLEHSPACYRTRHGLPPPR
jgi:hypothetical protein